VPPTPSAQEDPAINLVRVCATAGTGAVPDDPLAETGAGTTTVMASTAAALLAGGLVLNAALQRSR